MGICGALLKHWMRLCLPISRLYSTKKAGISLKAVAWGKSLNGEAGSISVYQPPQILNLPQPGKVQKISAGIQHNLALIDDRMYSWGSNYFGQLGITSMEYAKVDFEDECILEPYEIRALPGKISDIASGYFHNLCVTKGSVYSWGSGFLGHDNEIYDASMKKIKFALEVQNVYSSGYYSIFKAEDNAFYIWGLLPDSRPSIGNGSYSFLSNSVKKLRGTRKALKPLRIDSLVYHTVNSMFCCPTFFACSVNPFKKSDQTEMWVFGSPKKDQNCVDYPINFKNIDYALDYFEEPILMIPLLSFCEHGDILKVCQLRSTIFVLFNSGKLYKIWNITRNGVCEISEIHSPSLIVDITCAITLTAITATGSVLEMNNDELKEIFSHPKIKKCHSGAHHNIVY